MILPLTLALICGQDQSPLNSVIAERTGRNGYEEFVDAAILIQNSPLAKSENQPKIGDKDWLERRRQMVAQSSKALDLVRAGLEKPVSYPSPLTQMTPLPEVSLFKRLATAFAYRCSVMCADGNPVGAAEALADGFRFSKAVMSTGGEMHLLVGLAMSSIMFAEFDRSKAVLTIGGLDTIFKSLDHAEQISPMPNFEAAFSGSRRLCDTLLATPDVLLNVATDKDTADKWRRLPVDEQKSRIAAYLKACADGLSALGQVFQSPESTWSASMPDDLRFDLPFVPVVAELDPIGYLLERKAILPVANFRSRVRLLRLHTAILKHRWTHGALPPTLDPISDQLNPQTGKPFSYKLQGKSYQLWTTDLRGSGYLDLSRSKAPELDKNSELPRSTN